MPAREFTIVKVPGTWVVRAGGAVIAETKAALEFTEGEFPPVIYFPRGDVAMAFLDRSATVHSHERKGSAQHYSIVTKSTTLTDAAWSYEPPAEELARLAEHIAFASDKVTVERV